MSVTRKRRWLIFLLVLAVCLAAAYSVLLWAYSGSKTQSQLDRVQVGMTRDEVIAVFGGEPNGRYSDPNILTWVRKTDQAIVWLDEAGRVSRKQWCDASMDNWWIRIWRIMFLPN